jgi:MFS family permease
MTLRQLKTGYFAIAGLNSFATSFYFYYLFFFMQRQFGFGNLGNLSLAAMNGLIYMIMSWQAGRFGQRYGYHQALGLGLGIMVVALVAGSLVTGMWSHIVVMAIWTVGICFTWPMLEALASEKEDPAGLQQMVGIYNLVWAGPSALAYFTGGVMLEKLGLRSLFWVPIGIHLGQIALLLWLPGRAAHSDAGKVGRCPPASGAIELNPRPIERAKRFLRMAWLANPFAYVAINTVVAVVPGLARKLELTPMWAGFFCSVWFFARLIAFLVLWRWRGWHYRLPWFLGAYLLMIASFALILLVPDLAVLFLAQVTFGSALGLIYYSSLYYSMDVGEAKAEHGGLHEAAIGAGLFAGPAIGATALRMFPAQSDSSVWAVSLALCAGLAGLLYLALRRRA